MLHNFFTDSQANLGASPLLSGFVFIMAVSITTGLMVVVDSMTTLSMFLLFSLPESEEIGLKRSYNVPLVRELEKSGLLRAS